MMIDDTCASRIAMMVECVRIAIRNAECHSLYKANVYMRMRIAIRPKTNPCMHDAVTVAVTAGVEILDNAEGQHNVE